MYGRLKSKMSTCILSLLFLRTRFIYEVIEMFLWVDGWVCESVTRSHNNILVCQSKLFHTLYRCYLFLMCDCHSCHWQHSISDQYFGFCFFFLCSFGIPRVCLGKFQNLFSSQESHDSDPMMTSGCRYSTASVIWVNLFLTHWEFILSFCFGFSVVVLVCDVTVTCSVTSDVYFVLGYY